MTRAFDHVGVEGTLRQEIDLPQRCGLAFEDLNEGRADPPALFFRVDNPQQRSQERVAGVDGLHVDAQVPLHHVFDPAPLITAEQSVVHEQAGQLTWQRTMHQRRAHRRVDAAREAAEDPSITHLLANRDRGLLDERGRLPRAPAARHRIEKIPDNLTALRGMNHLRVEGDAETPGIVSHRRDQ